MNDRSQTKVVPVTKMTFEIIETCFLPQKLRPFVKKKNLKLGLHNLIINQDLKL